MSKTRARNLSFWDHERLTLEKVIDLAAASFCHYFAQYHHGVIAWRPRSRSCKP